MEHMTQAEHGRHGGEGTIVQLRHGTGRQVRSLGQLAFLHLVPDQQNPKFVITDRHGVPAVENKISQNAYNFTQYILP